MTAKKFTDLPVATELADDDIFAVSQDVGGTPESRGATAELLGKYPIIPIGVACSDETSDLSAGAAKITFRMPFAFKLVDVRASLSAAQPSGSILTIDINEGGSSILSTKLTIDNTEKTSTSAATPAVISDPDLSDDAEITVDIDQVGAAGAKGLKVWLIGRRT